MLFVQNFGSGFPCWGMYCSTACPTPDLKGAALSHQRGMVMEVDAQGKITALLEDKGGNTVRTVTEVVEHDGKLWMGTMGVAGIPTFEFEKYGFPCVSTRASGSMN